MINRTQVIVLLLCACVALSFSTLSIRGSKPTTRHRIEVLLKEYNDSTLLEIYNTVPATLGNIWLGSTQFNDSIQNIGLFIHEGFHYTNTMKQNSLNPGFRILWINDSIEFKCVVNDLPETQTVLNLDYFNNFDTSYFKRLRVYIFNVDTNVISQKFGYLGLMEELWAYYYEIQVDVLMVNYSLKCKEPKDENIAKLLSKMSSTKCGIYELYFYTQSYLSHLQKNDTKYYQSHLDELSKANQALDHFRDLLKKQELICEETISKVIKLRPKLLVDSKVVRVKNTVTQFSMFEYCSEYLESLTNE